mmetsp:Transcript_5187/g.11765  ORF Transcript_5187/g.11765 Transcript_5187/m.11765 type:complete len:85 (-) Transcript_5187:615-869(-)
MLFPRGGGGINVEVCSSIDFWHTTTTRRSVRGRYCGATRTWNRSPQSKSVLYQPHTARPAMAVFDFQLEYLAVNRTQLAAILGF